MHPSVFAVVDGDGYVEIWDINRDAESPIVHKKAFEVGANAAYKEKEENKNKALHCIKWSTDGRKLAIGDSDGFVSIWNVDSSLCNPRQEDFDKIEILMSENSTEAS